MWNADDDIYSTRSPALLACVGDRPSYSFPGWNCESSISFSLLIAIDRRLIEQLGSNSAFQDVLNALNQLGAENSQKVINVLSDPDIIEVRQSLF